jgi:hypothetical protein
MTSFFGLWKRWSRVINCGQILPPSPWSTSDMGVYSLGL